MFQRTHPQDRALGNRSSSAHPRRARTSNTIPVCYCLSGTIKRVRATCPGISAGIAQCSSGASPCSETPRRSLIGEQEAQLATVDCTTRHAAWSALPDGSNSYANKRKSSTAVEARAIAGSVGEAGFHPNDLEDISKVVCVRAATSLVRKVRFRRADGQYRLETQRGVPREMKLAKSSNGMASNRHHRSQAGGRENPGTRGRTPANPRSRTVPSGGTGGRWEAMYLNKAGLDYHGLTREAWQDYDPHSLIHPDDHNRILTGAGQAKLLSGQPSKTKRACEKRRGIRWFLFRFNPLRDGKDASRAGTSLNRTSTIASEQRSDYTGKRSSARRNRQSLDV